MSIHLYADAELTQRISEGDMSSPDTDTYDGGTGESKDRQLFLANEQATLAADIGAYDAVMALSSPAFRDGEMLLIGQEMVTVVSGGGTVSLTVERGVCGTSAAQHVAGTRVYAAYNYDGLVVQPMDTQSTDESSWCTLSLTQEGLDSATPGQSLSLGPKRYDTTLSLWRRMSVPAGTPVQNKTDLRLRITGIESLA